MEETTMDDMKELEEMLDVVSKKVPKLIRELVGTLYSPESGANMGQAVGAFYKGLVESGLPADVAVEMAKEYSLSFTQIIKAAQNNG